MVDSRLCKCGASLCHGLCEGANSDDHHVQMDGCKQTRATRTVHCQILSSVHTQSLMTSVHRVFLHAKVAKAEQPTHTTHRVSRHSLRRICNGLAASYRASHTLMTGFFTEPKDHTRSAPPRPIAGDVYATHPELMASHHSHITSPASSTSSGRRFLHRKRHSDGPVSVSPPPFTVTSVTPSVIFITCRAQR
jgi:hypothetical protein